MTNLEEMSAFFNNFANKYEHHMIENKGMAEFYDEVEKYIPVRKNLKVLDLGCGTGLQTERVFNVNPDAEVFGIDLAPKMLEVCRVKFADKNIKFFCGSYFDVDFGSEIYDLVISTYSFHHFYEDKKLTLYKKIYNSLKKGGIFIEGDSTADSFEKEKCLIEESEKLTKEKSGEGFYHLDIPLFYETQRGLYEKAGFTQTSIKKKWEVSALFLCVK